MQLLCSPLMLRSLVRTLSSVLYCLVTGSLCSSFKQQTETHNHTEQQGQLNF